MVEAELFERRSAIFNALNTAIKIFTSHSEKTFDDVMSNGLRPIAEAAGLDRIVFYRTLNINKEIHFGQIYRWGRIEGGLISLDDELRILPNLPVLNRWISTLMNDKCVNLTENDMAEDEKAFLGPFGIKSILMTPIFSQGEFWGAVSFQDHTNVRCIDDGCSDFLYSAACLCANSIIRSEFERKLTGTYEFNRATIDAAPIGFTVFDETMAVIDANNAILNLLGCTKQTYIDHFFEFMPEHQPSGEKSGEQAVEIISQALNGENSTFEWTHLALSGELIPFEVTLARMKYKGKYIVLCYQSDLRNTKMMMKSIRDQSDQLKIRLEQQALISEISRSFVSSGDSKALVYEAIAKLGHFHKVSMVVIFSIDYKHNSINPEYHWSAAGESFRFINFNRFELIESRFPKRLPDCTTVPVFSCADISTCPNEDFYALLSINVNAFICAPIYVEGVLWGTLNVEQCHKPREWKMDEIGFVAMAASTIAGAIRLDIYNSQLKDAIKKLTTASRAKSEFLSNMSHEMRTPMNAIINMTAIAQKTTDIERKNYALGKIEDASTHLLGVINDILDMSKIEANKFELTPVDFVFEKVLQRVVNVINFRVDEKHQKLTVHIDKNIPKILNGDDQRLSQVITNLLGNAVKFTPENGLINLDTKLLKEANGICTIQISVADTGIGISTEQQARLFQSFQQAETSTVRKYGGTGLGLSISKNIVEMMSGKIWVESEANKGATFTFTIMAKRGEEKKSGLLADSLQNKAINWETIRILAVDDDPVILEFFQDIAQNNKIHCDTASSGESALRMVNENNAYDFYFIDWNMPGMDGIALSNALKAKEQNAENAVIIMISAIEWNVIKDEAQKAGINRFLSKPLFPSTIIDLIGEYLGLEQEQPAADQQNSGGVFPGHRILLVEDVEINREIVLTLLESTQVEIDCAENGKQAVEMFSDDPDKYEIIFMDVQMPEMDGYEASRQIRNIEEKLDTDDEAQEDSADSEYLRHPGRRVPIIAMTANVFREDVEKCLNAGMDDHIGKPLDFEIVMEKLHTYLKSEKK